MITNTEVYYRDDPASDDLTPVSRVDPLPVSIVDDSAENVMHFDSDGDNTAQVCRGSAGYIDYIHVINSNAADAFIQFFDLASASVTVGTTTPSQSWIVPGNGAFERAFPKPIHFQRAITYACTTTATGSGDPSTGLTVNVIHH